MNRSQRIHDLLATGLATDIIEIVDESHLHAGHAGAASGGGHFRIRVVSSRFEGVNKVGRHRLVYDCLREMMQQDIHALAMALLTPSEAQAA
jgi:BolA protein